MAALVRAATRAVQAAPTRGAPAWAQPLTDGGNAGGKPVTQQPGNGTLQPGTDAYKAANTQLQTGPIQAANEVIANRGIGQTSQNVINNVMGGGGANNWMNQAAGVFQNPGQIGTGQFNQIYNNAQNVQQVGTGNLERFMGQAMPNGQVGQQDYQGVYDRAGQPGAAEQYLTGPAQGQYLGGSPYLDDIVPGNCRANIGRGDSSLAIGIMPPGSRRNAASLTLANSGLTSRRRSRSASR